MPDDTDDRCRQHEEMLHDVRCMLAIQHTIERIDHALEGIHRPLAHVEMMQAHMDTLVARVLRSQKKGQEA